MFGWLLPFEPEVWILIIFTLFWSGLVYMLIEYLAFPGQYAGKRAGESLGNDIFLSFLLFTQNFQFNPKTPASRILATSMAFWALLITSTYTANLASFFVDESNQRYEIVTIEDAIRLGKPVCIHETTASAVYVQQAYPNALYIKVKEEMDLYHSVNNGVCAVAVTTSTSYQDYSRTREPNADCRLHWTGNMIKPSRAGFATKADAGRKCTSLINDVVNLHILEMQADGFLARAWDDHFARNEDHFCDGSQKGEQSQRRSIHEMGGTFAFHFALSCIALFMAVATKLWRVYKNQKSMAKAELDNEALDVPGALPKTDSEVSERTRAISARTLLQDFWEETPSMKMKDSTHLRPCHEASSTGNAQLLRLLQDQFQRQQDQLEEKWEQQQQPRNQFEQRIQKQITTMMEQKMQQQHHDQLQDIVSV